MATFKRFEDIFAWQLAHRLCEQIQVIARNTALAKDYRLKDQILDSSDSIKSNIAEGFGRLSNRQFIQFLQYAHASCGETRSQLSTVLSRGYIDQSLFEELDGLARQTSSAIYKLIAYLEKFEASKPTKPGPHQL